MPQVTGEACAWSDDRWMGRTLNGSRVAGQQIASGSKRPERNGDRTCPSLIFPRLQP
ncbi:hypothetical protein [Azospirillum argentinense]|uniref:Uncharacterized protein n=1 Tax=Azospirillum argentinense TaxID=2970906 RepID=A0A5B0KRT3_9PROT|nr:hypothetical protein FH063_005924 [Azospirillum argentinense]